MSNAKNVLNQLGYKSPGHLVFKMPAVSMPQNLSGSGATGKDFGKKIADNVASQIISVVKSAMGKGGAMPKRWVPFGDIEYKYGSGNMKGAGILGSLGGMLGSSAGNALGGLFGFGNKCECTDLKGAGILDAFSDAFSAIPTAIGQVQNGISGVINNPREIGSRIGSLVDIGEKAGQYANRLMPYKGLVGSGNEKGTGILGSLGGMLGSSAGNALGGLFGFGMPKKPYVGRGGSQKLQIPRVYVDLAAKGDIESVARRIANELGGYLGDHAENLLNRVVKVKGSGSRTEAKRVNAPKEGIKKARQAMREIDAERERKAEEDAKIEDLLEAYRRERERVDRLPELNPGARKPPREIKVLPVRPRTGMGKKTKAGKKLKKEGTSGPKKLKGKGKLKTSA